MVLVERTPCAGAAPFSPLQRSTPRASREASPPSDPILPYLRSIKKAIDEIRAHPECYHTALEQLKIYVTECIDKYGDDYQYSTDPRLLKIWILYGDAVSDFDKVYTHLEEKRMFLEDALLYESYALFLCAQGRALEADKVYGIGISRKAEPLDHLKKMHINFLKQLESIVEESDEDAQPKPSKIQKREFTVVDPWSDSTMSNLLTKINGGLKKLTGYHKSNKIYSGKVPLTSSHNALKNKVVELGGRKYHIKGSSGTGAFAKLYKASVDGNTEEIVALKVQKPAFPWEFYIYRQLDMRISDIQRPSYGYAHEVHVFADVSVLVCNFLPYETLLDAINSHLVVGQHMDEVLCIYYTMEMLHMLETLHSVGIIHGDFKPDNMLVCYPSEEITDDTFRSETRSGQNQGLCLIDWGRGIDVNLFPAGTEFLGDCGTSGFSCIEMQEERSWTYQVDTFGLCVVAHMMLHGEEMSIAKVPGTGGNYMYQPKLSFKRYWNVALWKQLFTTLLNPGSNGNHVGDLRSLRRSFQDYMCSNYQLVVKLNQLLAKQKASLCSS
ncbi:mitotic checkpoint serine/threonine-protein kinase BUB1-like [Triticum dicoccoides]|uniref:mitotic checkpoint serine/threonine-protein kinase BUB1-like n=1 Tax=Triticum dicoccoides TaxID=85692 RepID=UPI0003D52E71|nr:mitotic checkpoint serine/threonine-protein kinase BUB1-like [Triticum dicoccoides]